MRLILVRHGESWHGQRQIIGGPTGCTGLTPAGRAQAELLRDRLKRPGLLPDDAILLSAPWPRARETAEILQPAIGAAIRIDDRLRDLDPGESDGLTWDEYASRYGHIDLVAEPDRPFAPGGESYAAFSQRIHATLNDLALKFRDGTVVAVAHGGTVVQSMWRLLEIPRPGPGALLKPAYASLTIWTNDGGWTLERYNDTAHLE